jgi:hypothetical protein
VWTADESGFQPFSVSSNFGGPGWCQNGTLVAPQLPVGLTGQHCWRPTNGEPFQLNMLSLTQRGAHSFYLGPVVGTPTVNAGVTLSYSAVISCADWLGQACPPLNIAPPAVQGVPAVGQALTVDDGTWTPDPGQTYTYQWLRCASSTGSCSQIDGATGSTYTVTTADRNFWLTASLTATNAGGGAQPATAARVGPVPP